MGADIRNYQTAEGLDDEQMSALLTDRLGRPISPAGYRIIKGRRDSPEEWLEALNIAPSEPTYPGAPDDDKPAADNADKPAGPPAAVVLPFEPASAQMQITILYTVAGRGASMALNSPQVASVWANQAPAIAAGYIKWARENATVAHYINVLTFGGPAGELLMMHAGLLIQTLIVANPDRFGEGMLPPNMRRQPQETDTLGEPPEGDDNGDDDEPEPPTPKRRASSTKG